MARVIQEAYNLLAAVDYLVVADLGSFSERHGAAIRILSNVRDASEQVLHFAGLLPDCLRQHNVQTVGIGALGAAYDRHVGTVGATTGDYLVAGQDQCVGEHLDELLVGERQVSSADDGDFLRTALLN